MNSKIAFKYAKYVLIMIVAFMLSQGLSTTVFVSGTPQINTTFIAGIMNNVKSTDFLANTIAFFKIDQSKSTPVALSNKTDYSEETKANLVNVAAVAPRVVEDGIEIREYGNVAQITIPRKLFEGK